VAGIKSSILEAFPQKAKEAAGALSAAAPVNADLLDLLGHPIPLAENASS